MLSGVKRSIPYVTIREWSKALRRHAKLSAYRGSEHRCPICGTGLRAFKPIWKSFWRAVEQYAPVHHPSKLETLNLHAYSCPRCDASDRERLTALYLDRVFQSFDRDRRYRLIEFAPGHALHRKLKTYPFLDYRSADLVRRDVTDRDVDMTDMKIYGDNSVDIFLCSHILEHVPDDRSAIAELCRILKPGGFGIVLVPLIDGHDETHEDPAINTPEGRWKYFGDGDHVRQYGKRDFLGRLSTAGLQIEQVTMDFFGTGVFKCAGIADDSILYVVRKAPTAG